MMFRREQRAVSSEIADLLERVRSAAGSDGQLDADISRCLDDEQPDQPSPYTSSIDRCIELLHSILPLWAWHTGFGPRGVMPYASVSKDDMRFEATAATVPLALLQAILEAKLAEATSEP